MVLITELATANLLITIHYGKLTAADNVEATAIKLGKDGALGILQSQKIQVKSIPVKVIDTVGAAGAILSVHEPLGWEARSHYGTRRPERRAHDSPRRQNGNVTCFSFCVQME
ncbi:MAG: hypothetical protein HY869_04325 [Chloroflexi bacterium]|nr:hypothetical protein [Chloroflexota bacterium]